MDPHAIPQSVQSGGARREMRGLMPIHASLPVGESLPPDYFSPGTYVFGGLEQGSPWAVAYFAGQSYRYERAGLGEPWVRVS